MPKAERVSDFLGIFTEWARNRQDILALALVGSYARAAAGEDSDVDLVIISSRPEQYLADLSWAANFGVVERHQIEDYGNLTSVRAWYSDGLEVEYGITGQEWASSPLEEGTRQVISGGLVVLLEQGDMLSRHRSEGQGGRSVA